MSSPFDVNRSGKGVGHYLDDWAAIAVTIIGSPSHTPMTATRTARPQTASAEIPAMPLTVEGYSVLHQMMRFRWGAWRQASTTLKEEITQEAVGLLSKMEQGSVPAGSDGQSALYSLLGHKGDLMFVHFRASFDELNRAEMQISQLRLNDYLEPAASYLSVIELGLYESSVKTYRDLAEQGIEPHSEEWKQAINEILARQKEAMRPRLFPEIPKSKYVCFYPMDRRRGESKNWYTLPIEERARQMHEHGLVGRRYSGEVRQIISGSIGFDDWEWGVDLFADDPLVFKKLIYEMRFDEVSAVYALFGTFYVGLRCAGSNLSKLLNGGAE
jgi:hydrogen peroxide-dependent heme synthase